MTCNRPRTLFCATLLSCVLTGPAMAAGESQELVVDAGKHDRINTPVTVLIDAPQGAKSVTLTDADGNKLPAQLTAPGLRNASAKGKRELHFILPSLKQGASMKLTAGFSTAAAEEAFRWKSTPDESSELRLGERPVLRYVCMKLTDANREEAYKVYHHLYNPAGTELVTKGPGGLYPHHRGLFFGYCNVSYGDGRKANTWSGRNTPQTHGGILAEEAGPVLGRHLAADRADRRRGHRHARHCPRHRQTGSPRPPHPTPPWPDGRWQGPAWPHRNGS